MLVGFFVNLFCQNLEANSSKLKLLKTCFEWSLGSCFRKYFSELKNEKIKVHAVCANALASISHMVMKQWLECGQKKRATTCSLWQCKKEISLPEHRLGSVLANKA